MLLIDGILHVVELTLVDLEELVGSWIRGKSDGFVELTLKRSLNILNNSIRRSNTSLLNFFYLHVLHHISLVQLHINLSVRIDVDHSFLISILISCLSKPLLTVSSIRVTRLSDGVRDSNIVLLLLKLGLGPLSLLYFHIYNLDCLRSKEPSSKIIDVKPKGVLLNLDLIVTLGQVLEHEAETFSVVVVSAVDEFQRVFAV